MSKQICINYNTLNVRFKEQQFDNFYTYPNFYRKVKASLVVSW